MSDDWQNKCKVDVSLYKKIFVDEAKEEREYFSKSGSIKLSEKQPKRLDTDFVLNINYSNIEALKRYEKLERNNDMSFKICNQLSVRNKCYLISACCMRSQHLRTQLVRESDIMEQIVEDLSLD